MAKGVIVEKLDNLACLRAERDTLDAAIAAVFPRQAELEAEIKALEASIKASAEHIPASQAHTLVGCALQLSWRPGGPVSYIRADGWAIVKVGKK